MTRVSPDNPYLGEIGIDDIARYLFLHSWKRTDFSSDRVVIFSGPDDDEGNSLELVLPQNMDFADARVRLADAVNLVAAVEDRSVYEVLRSIAAVDRDIVYMRVLNGRQRLSISLERGVTILKELRDLVAFSACAEQDPRPYFAKATAKGKEYAEKCYFGHTFRGSFGFSIESPVPPSPKDRLFTEPPFERRVIERIFLGLASARDAVLSGAIEDLTETYDTGLNANMCEALIHILENSTDAGLEYRVSWSPNYDPPEELRSRSTVRLEQGGIQYLDSAARKLRTPKQSALMTVTGRIVQLRSNIAPDEDVTATEEHTITISGKDGDSIMRKLRVSLSPPEYREACDAHKDGKDVSVSGRLEKVGKFWALMAPKDFSVQDLSRDSSANAK